MNDLGYVGPTQYALKQKQIALNFICIMISSVDALTYVWQPEYYMNSIEFETYARDFNQSDLNFICIIVS